MKVQCQRPEETDVTSERALSVGQYKTAHSSCTRKTEQIFSADKPSDLRLCRALFENRP